MVGELGGGKEAAAANGEEAGGSAGTGTVAETLGAGAEVPASDAGVHG